MGTTFGSSSISTTIYIHFEDVLHHINLGATIINTLPENNQKCLIKNTIPAEEEENHINQLLDDAGGAQAPTIIIYGENSADTSVETKYKQLKSLGFTKVYIYRGGMFEWILLQNIYGADNIPTTTPEKDILKFLGRRHGVPPPNVL